MCSALCYLDLLCDAQAPDEASVIAEAKARLPSEPGSSDPNGCRIGEPCHLFLFFLPVECQLVADVLFAFFSKY